MDSITFVIIKITRMKIKLFTLFICLLMAFGSKAQMVMGSESFDNVTFAPAGWSIKPIITPVILGRDELQVHFQRHPHIRGLALHDLQVEA